MEEYFDLLEEPLPKWAVRAVLEEGKRPLKVVKGMYGTDIMVAGRTLLSSMPYFWRYKDTGRAVADELRGLTRAKKVLTAYYSGAEVPIGNLRFVRRTLLYADVVVMKDPVSHASPRPCSWMRMSLKLLKGSLTSTRLRPHRRYSAEASGA